MMTAQQAAGVVIRMFALWWLVDSTFYFIDVPSELMGILHYRTLPNGGTALDQFFALQREIGLGLIVNHADRLDGELHRRRFDELVSKSTLLA